MFSGVLHKTNPLLLCGACALLVVFFISTLALPFTAHAAWYNSSWDYRVKITIDNTQVGADLTDFPVYVNLSDLPAGFHTNVNSDGGDIRVTKSDGTTEVPREVVSYDAGTDTGELHFKGDLSSSADTEFYIYYGNSGASDYAVTATYGRNNVWTAYEGVWHMGTSVLVDSTGKAADSTTNSGTISADTKLDGGSATDYSGSSQRSIIPGYAAISDDRVSDLYWWGWLESDAWSRQMEKSNQYFLIQFSGAGDSGPLIKPNNKTASVGSLSTGVYYQIGGRFTQTSGSDGVLDAILNGTINDTTTGLPQITSVGNTDLYLGSDDTSTYMNGRIDEFRISGYKSNDWISAEYTNQNTPTTFYTAGSQEEDSSTSVGMTGSSYNITFDSLNSAGLDTSVSSSYGLLDTVGEVGTGRLSSTSYGIRAGYRQMNSGQISITAPADVNMTNLSGITADTSTGSVTWTVTTDNPDGYELSIRSSTNPALQDASEGNAIDNYTPATSDPDFTFSIANSTAEFGFSPEGDDVAQRFLDNGSSCNTGAGNTTDRCWDAFSTSDVVISERATSNQVGGTDTTVKFQAQNGSDHVQEAGTYEAVITVTAVTL